VRARPIPSFFVGIESRARAVLRQSRRTHGNWVRRLPGNQECPRNPDLPVEITLPEPLGDRKLVDGSTIPPRDATVPAD
jgi:hypothetical protein